MKSRTIVFMTMIIVLSQSCSTLGETAIPTEIPPTETLCAWTENPGPPPPELMARAKEIFAASGFLGEIKVSGNGEWNSCDGFHLRGVDFEFRLDVADLEDTETMILLASQVQDIPTRAVNGQWGINYPLRILFRKGNEFCWWWQEGKVCGEIMKNPPP